MKRKLDAFYSQAFNTGQKVSQIWVQNDIKQWENWRIWIKTWENVPLLGFILKNMLDVFWSQAVQYTPKRSSKFWSKWLKGKKTGKWIKCEKYFLY